MTINNALQSASAARGELVSNSDEPTSYQHGGVSWGSIDEALDIQEGLVEMGLEGLEETLEEYLAKQ